MDAAVQAFKDKMAEKRAAKEKTLAAVAVKDWDAVAKYGINGGEEGKAFAEMQKMADAYVKANASQFAHVAEYVNPEGHEPLVKLISLMSTAGMEEEVLKLTMFELASFERQQIGVAASAQVRLVGKGN